MVIFLLQIKVICNDESLVCISIHYLNAEEPDLASKQELHKTQCVCVCFEKNFFKSHFL